MLFVGPHQPYLAYVADVLPSLGEEGVQTCTLRDLLPEGAAAPTSPTRRWPGSRRPPTWCGRSSRRSGSTRSRRPRAWRSRRRGPTSGSARTTGPRRSSRSSPARRTTRAATRSGRSCSPSWWTSTRRTRTSREDLVRRALAQNDELVDAFGRAWPLIDPTDLVGDLWSVPAYLRRCAPWLEPDEVRLLQRADPQAWTRSDLPLLDAARQRLGDPGLSPPSAGSAPRRRPSARRCPRSSTT